MSRGMRKRLVEEKGTGYLSLGCLLWRRARVLVEVVGDEFLVGKEGNGEEVEGDVEEFSR